MATLSTFLTPFVERLLNILLTRVSPLLALVGISVDRDKFLAAATYAVLQLLGILWENRTHAKAFAEGELNEAYRRIRWQAAVTPPSVISTPTLNQPIPK